MGTGKTFVTVHTASARFTRKQINAVMVICPMTLRNTWKREFDKWAPGLADLRNLDLNDSRFMAWCAETGHKLKVLLVSVEGLGISQKLPVMAQHFVDTHQVMAVCDESSRIKNPDANRTKVVISLGANAKYKMILNGTHTAKGIQDLWAQYEFLDPNIIGSGDYWAFKTRYLVMGGYKNKQVIGYSKVDELMDLIRPYTLEVGKEVLNLPPKIRKTIYLQATPEQNRLFERIASGISDIGEPMIKAQNVLERMLRMQQVVGGFEPVTNPETMETSVVPLPKNPKMDALFSIIEDNYVGSKFIIWARYIPEIAAIKEALIQKYGLAAVVDYYGETSPEQRSINEDRYCRDPECRFFVGNPAAAGLGLTLISNENDVMIYYSGTFAYIDRAQSEDRAHRIGQTRTVTVVDFIIEGSIDQVIQRSIAEKTDLDVFIKEQIAKGHKVSELLRGCVRTLDTSVQE
jgi:SNF2 family DNA or RNA helicase